MTTTCPKTQYLPRGTIGCDGAPAATQTRWDGGLAWTQSCWTTSARAPAAPAPPGMRRSTAGERRSAAARLPDHRPELRAPVRPHAGCGSAPGLPLLAGLRRRRTLGAGQGSERASAPLPPPSAVALGWRRLRLRGLLWGRCTVLSSIRFEDEQLQASLRVCSLGA